MNMHHKAATLIPINGNQPDWSEKHEIGKLEARMIERAMELLVENYRVTERHLAVEGHREAARGVSQLLRQAEALRKRASDCHSIRIIPDEDQ